MKKLLLSPMQVRLVVCSCVSLVLVAAYFASAFLFIVLVPWHKARTNYEKWISGEKQRCERLYYDQVIQVSSSKDPGVRLSSQNPDEYTKLLNPDEYAKMLRQTAVTGVVPKLAKDFQPEVKQPADKAVIATEEDKRENKLLIEATGRAAAAGDSTLEDEARQLGFKIGDSPEIIKSNVVEFRRRTDILDSERKGREFATPMVGWLDWRRKLADWDGSCPVSYEAYTPSVKRDPFDDLIDNQIAIRQGAVFNDAGTLSST